MTPRSTVLFHRDFRNFTGGHLKVWHYYNHVATSGSHRAAIYFSPESLWDETNPWLGVQQEVTDRWEPDAADALFLGGFDWQMLPAAERDHSRRPIFNLIQHVHHGDPAHPMSEFLRHRAIRICVSEEVREAIAATGRVNGPVSVIPNGIDLTDLPPILLNRQRPVDWLICGLKDTRSKLARNLARRLAGQPGWGRVEALTKPIPRAGFLAGMARTRRVVLLPRETEGFYLPALEAMALGTVVVCLDCVGNRSFCRSNFNALVPVSDSEESVIAAMAAARDLSAADEATLIEHGRAVAARHTLGRERTAFHELLASAAALW